jgi:hypothetical protein
MWANVGGQLVFRGAQLTGVPFAARQLGNEPGAGIQVTAVRLGTPALNVYGINVAGDMICDNGFAATGGASFEHASIGVLYDDKRSWPESLGLDGFTYGDLNPYLPARDRLGWLGRSTEYQSQPYEHLAYHYRRLGYGNEARRVLLAKQRARTHQQPWWNRWWGWLQDGLVGYGYAPGRAFLLLLSAFLLGWGYFWIYRPAPVNPFFHPTYYAAIYTVNLLLPVPVLGQPSDWDPHGAALLVALLLRTVGWLLIISVAAAITRALSRD